MLTATSLMCMDTLATGWGNDPNAGRSQVDGFQTMHTSCGKKRPRVVPHFVDNCLRCRSVISPSPAVMNAARSEVTTCHDGRGMRGHSVAPCITLRQPAASTTGPPGRPQEGVGQRVSRAFLGAGRVATHQSGRYPSRCASRYRSIFPVTGRPTAAYFARTRSMYVLALWAEISMLRATASSFNPEAYSVNARCS
jgi:hypothetical protein